jgi:endonuclease-3
MQTYPKQVLEILSSTYPVAKCELVHNTAWELLVGVVLSAQCTDKRVNMVTKELFSKHPDIKDINKLEIEKLKEIIRPTGFFNNKAKYIKLAAEKIISDYDGIVPSSMEELLKIPGLARKSSNVILSVWYGENEGVVVDTHVIRIANLLHLTKNKDPIKIEKDLIELYPRKYWERISTLIVWHGRRICIARKPKCEECPLNKICPSAFLNKKASLKK